MEQGADQAENQSQRARRHARQPLVGVALAAVLGIVGAEIWNTHLAVGAGICLGTCAALWRWRRTVPCLLAVGTTFFFVHSLAKRHSPGIRLAEQIGHEPCTVRMQGVVVDEPDPNSKRGHSGNGSRFRFRAKKVWRFAENGWENRALECGEPEIWVHWRGGIPEYGAFLELEGRAQRVGRARNPGEFDRYKWMERRGIWTELLVGAARDGQVLGGGEGSVLGACGIAARRWARERLEVGMEKEREYAAVVESMVLGLRGEMGVEVREWFRETGTLHLFAVSGQNVMMLMLLLGAVFRWIRVPRRIGALGLIGMLVGYALMTGGSASCIRAGVMGALMVGGLLADRPPLLYNSVAAGALVILAADTRQLMDLGFELSFLQVLVLAWGAPRLSAWIEPLGMPDPFLPRRLWTMMQSWKAGLWVAGTGAIAVAVAGWLGSLPISLAVFHLWVPAGLLANLYVVPLAFVLLAVGLLSLGVGWVWDPVGCALNWFNGWIVKVLLAGLQSCAGLPGGHAYVGHPKIPVPAWELTVYDLGNGAAAYLRSGGSDWLLDCGSGTGFRQVVLPGLRMRGVDGLNGMILTHGDTEHVGGAWDAVRELNPAEIGVGPFKERSAAMRRLHAELGHAGRGLAFYRTGDRVELGDGAWLEVLYPPAGVECSAADDRALVCRLVTARGRVLLSSDAGYWTEHWLMERHVDVAADLWVMGRHLRDPGGSREFLEAVNPVAVVCCGGGEKRESGLGDRFRGCAVFHQTQTGAVEVTGSAEGWLEIKGYVNGQRLRSLAR